MKHTVRIRNVTTAFILRGKGSFCTTQLLNCNGNGDNNDIIDIKNIPELLLLKRSDKVRTYKKHWAGVSGAVEEGEIPIITSAREIKEETGLEEGKDVELIRKGRPLYVHAEGKYNSVFIVHPFLYTLKDSKRSKINIDWEHSCYKWVKYDKFLRGEVKEEEEEEEDRNNDGEDKYKYDDDKYDEDNYYDTKEKMKKNNITTVPDLIKTLRRVLPYDIGLYSDLLNIRNNREEGAVFLACKAVRSFNEVVNRYNPSLEKIRGITFNETSISSIISIIDIKQSEETPFLEFIKVNI